MTRPFLCRLPATASLAAIAVLSGAPIAVATAQDAALATPWQSGEASRARLIAGGVGLAGQSGGPRVTAGLEITLTEGWKTYWRNPGSSGVPPRLDWAGSENLASATLQFPAPDRFADRDGDTIGYKTAVVLPIAIMATDATKPVKLKLEAEYGVCKDVCIPVQHAFEFLVPTDGASRPAGAALTRAVDRIPRAAADRRANDPVATGIKVDLAGAKPRIVIDAEFPGGTTGADVFLEAPEGLWVPLAKAGAASGNRRTFEVDLTDGADLADLKGRMIRLTLVSAAGQSETQFKLE